MNASPLTRGRSLLFSDNVPAKLSRRCRQKAEGKPWCWWIRAPCWEAAWWSPPSKQFRAFSAGSRTKFAFLAGFERLQAEPDPGSRQKERNLLPTCDPPWVPAPKPGSTCPVVASSRDPAANCHHPALLVVGGEGRCTHGALRSWELAKLIETSESRSGKSLLIKHLRCFMFPTNWKHGEDDPRLNFGWPCCLKWALVTSRTVEEKWQYWEILIYMLKQQQKPHTPLRLNFSLWFLVSYIFLFSFSSIPIKNKVFSCLWQIICGNVDPESFYIKLRIHYARHWINLFFY